MRMGTRIVGAGAIAATLFAGGALVPATSDRPTEARILTSADTTLVLSRPGVGSMAATIEALQQRLRDVPQDARSQAALGLAYVQQARITGDPSYYPKAEAVLRHAVTSGRDPNADALLGMASLDLARHEFAEALEWGRKAVAADAYRAMSYGMVGDALVELGRYGAGFRAYQRMIDLRPDLSSYARASYARELQGDIPGAIRLMRLALRSAGSPEDAAWARFQLGELYWTVGRLTAAEAAYRSAVRLTPSFLHPQAGLARVSWARGRLDDAIRRYRRVVARFPAPEHVAALGDLYAASGRQKLAEDQFALVAAEQDLFRANGVNVDVESALFDADHGRPAHAVRAARAAWSERKSVHTADALAWTLHVSGRDRAALRFAERALVLGTRNALFLYHAAMIHLDLRHEDRARTLLSEALRTNPHFSIIHSPRARRALARLGGRA